MSYSYQSRSRSSPQCRAADFEVTGALRRSRCSELSIVIRGVNAKDAENRWIPFDEHGRLAPILKRRSALGLDAYVFGTPDGEFQDSFKTAWESLQLVVYGH